MRTFLLALSCGTALGHALGARPQAGGAPVNDACSGAIEIPCDGTPFIADNTFATTLPSDPRFECDVLPVFGAGTIWYRFTATRSAVRILSTPMGDLTDGGDLALLQGGCDGFTSLRCTRPLTGLSTRLVSSELEPGQEYYIELASSLLGPLQGERLLTVECLNIDPPSNDDRINAIPLDFCEPQAFVTTGATSKSSLYNTVWYVVVGTQFSSMQCQAFSVDIENLSFTVTAGLSASPFVFSTTFFGRAYADWTSHEGVPYFIEIGSTMPDEGIGALIVSEGGGISGVCGFGGSNTCTTVAFETQDDGVTPLVNGQEIGSDLNGFFAITTLGANAGAVAYSSDPGGDNTSSSDGDLLVDTGNLLILQNNNNATVLQQSVPGIFDTPNDDPEGGAIRFEFMVPAAPMSLQLVDVDNDGSSNQVVLTDVAGRQRTYTVPDEWTGDRSEGEPGMGTLDLTTLNSQPGFGSTATSFQDTAFDDQAVTCIEVRLAGSGAVDDLSWCTDSRAFSAATALSRNGSGVNPMSFGSWSRPTLGGTWVTSLDCSAHSAGGAVVFIFRSPLDGFPTPFGELLVGGQPIFSMGQVHQGESVYFEAPVPSSLALLGRVAYAQGLCTGSPGPQLTNALDITLGF